MMEKLAGLVQDIDSLVIATALGLASLTPGPAGQAGAVAAIAYDVKGKRWSGVALSAASMIPLVGYAPAFFKVGLLVFQLNGRLKLLEASESEIHGSPESFAVLMDCLGKYHRKLPNIWVTRRLRERLQRIMDMGSANPIVLGAQLDQPQEDSSSSTQIP
jgi:hypothetical protein